MSILSGGGVWLQGNLGIAAEHGFYIRRPGEEEWDALKEDAGSAWRDMVLPILKLYTESTDGSYTEEKESALVWNYSNADPDFGRWQVNIDSLNIKTQNLVACIPGFDVRSSEHDVAVE